MAAAGSVAGVTDRSVEIVLYAETRAEQQHKIDWEFGISHEICLKKKRPVTARSETAAAYTKLLRRQRLSVRREAARVRLAA